MKCLKYLQTFYLFLKKVLFSQQILFFIHYCQRVILLIRSFFNIYIFFFEHDKLFILVQKAKLLQFNFFFEKTLYNFKMLSFSILKNKVWSNFYEESLQSWNTKSGSLYGNFDFYITFTSLMHDSFFQSTSANWTVLWNGKELFRSSDSYYCRFFVNKNFIIQRYIFNGSLFYTSLSFVRRCF